jgi:hypothetical protein
MKKILKGTLELTKFSYVKLGEIVFHPESSMFYKVIFIKDDLIKIKFNEKVFEISIDNVQRPIVKIIDKNKKKDYTFTSGLSEGWKKYLLTNVESFVIGKEVEIFHNQINKTVSLVNEYTFIIKDAKIILKMDRREYYDFIDILNRTEILWHCL